MLENVRKHQTMRGICLPSDIGRGQVGTIHQGHAVDDTCGKDETNIQLSCDTPLLCRREFNIVFPILLVATI